MSILKPLTPTFKSIFDIALLPFFLLLLFDDPSLHSGTKKRGAVVGDGGKLPFSIRHDDIHIHLVSIEVGFQQEACSNDRFGFDGLSTSTYIKRRVVR